MNKINGFTLLEVLVSLVILSIIVVSFSQMILMELKIQKITGHRNQVSNWAQTMIEYAKTCKLSEMNGSYSPDDFTKLKALQDDFPVLKNIVNREEFIVTPYTNEAGKVNDIYEINVKISWAREEYVLTSLVFDPDEE